MLPSMKSTSCSRQKLALKCALLPPTMRAYVSGLRPPGWVAFSLSSRRKVCGLVAGLLVMPESWRYLSSSCSKSPGAIRGPCSIRTTLMPACASSRAMIPPAAPEPTTMKSTVSLVVKVLLAMGAPSGGVGLGARIGFEPRVILVVVTERRLPEVAVDEADQVPPRAVVVAAVLGHRREPEHGQAAHRGEEGRLVDVFQPGDLLRLGCRGERHVGAMTRGIAARELGQPLAEGRQLRGEEAAERVVDEMDHAGVARAGPGAAGDD